MKTSTKAKILIIGETRIRFDTVKTYGIYSKTLVEVIRHQPASLWERMLNGEDKDDPFNMGKVTQIERKVRVLKVETLQKDKFEFNEELHEIDVALSKLDAFFA